MSDFESDLPSNDRELQEFMMIEQQKAKVHEQLHEFNEICWEKCIGKPSNKLDSATETCLTNCVDRFIDTSILITQRFAQILQKRN
ncbi:mitochondrial import inner membrane translocase subunit Tim8 isoform X2 [Drosophila subobscura]|uniref:mitochondrial import inner membrane translocase subunit Tim8 isoform X2 n=1 Tax=Drosophila subobscura TaxID=7241 RepID=UPI00155AB2AE|nr:mitochondrial import inner membrane translocase subunit Tim8 isoform X2 [Drosophila subobscura]